MIVALGRRAAETNLYKNSNNSPLILEDYNKFDSSIQITAGTSNDLLQANKIARQCISLFETYLNDEGRESLSESTKSIIDSRIQLLIEESLKKAIDIIENDIFK